METLEETRERWLQLDQEGWERLPAKRKIQRPVKNIEEAFNRLADADKERLQTSLSLIFEARREYDRNAESVPARPEDLSQTDAVEAYRLAAQDRVAALGAELRWFRDVLRIGRRRFSYPGTARILREEIQRREQEQHRLEEGLAIVGSGEPASGDGVSQPDDERADNHEPGIDQQPPAEENALAVFENAHNEVQEAEERARRERGELGRGWWAALKLGEGGYGTATAFLKQNEHGVVIDRLTVKNAAFPDTTNFPFLWNEDKTVPTEITAMYRLRPLQGSSTVVRIRNWRISHEERRFRIMMEWCPYGSMYDVFSNSGYLNQEERRIPEPFIWYMFDCLVTAGLLMQRGDLEETYNLDWEFMTHRDIKPPNVFLGLPSTSTFQGYQTPKLGDFGLTIVLKDEDSRTHKYRMKYFYSSPEERYDNLEGATNNPQRITRKTNVWGIGITVWSMLKKVDGDRSLVGDNNIYKTRRMPVDFDKGETEYYSKELRDLVMRACEYLPERRPSLDELRREIRRCTGHGTRDLARGLRHAPADDPRFLRHGLILDKDRWPVGYLLDGGAGGEPRRPRPPPRRRKQPHPRHGEDDGEGNESSSESHDSFGGDAGAEAVFQPTALREKREEARNKREAQRERDEAFAKENKRETRAKAKGKGPAANDLPAAEAIDATDDTDDHPEGTVRRGGKRRADEEPASLSAARRAKRKQTDTERPPPRLKLRNPGPRRPEAPALDPPAPGDGDGDGADGAV